MTELSYLYDPAAYRAAQAEMDRRVEASPTPTTRSLVKQNSAVINEAEKGRLESVMAAAEAGLLGVAKHVGSQSLKETAELVGIQLPDEVSEPVANL